MGSQGPALAAPAAPAFSLAPRPWKAGKLPLRPAHFPCKGGLGRAAPCLDWQPWPAGQPLPAEPAAAGPECRWTQGEAGQALAGLGKSLSAGLGDKTGSGSRSPERAVAVGLLAEFTI